MDFDLSDEQKLLRDSAARFGEDHYAFSAWRARAAEGRGFDRANWGRMAGLGWLALNVPEADGGLGGSPIDTMVLMEAFGRVLMLEPYVSTCVIAPLLLRHAVAGPRRALMDAIAAGAAVVSLADAEPGSRFDLQHIATRAAPTDGGFVLSGDKSHALDGGVADWFIVPARTAAGVADAGGISLFLVPADAAGLSIHASRAMDHRINARLRLDGVRVGAEALIGDAGDGAPRLRQAVDHAIVARLAEALGAMDAVCEMTLQHLRTRQQFGQPLGAFQALQHRAVDMAIACEEARSMTYLATLSLDKPEAERGRIVAAAKARVSQTSLYVGRQAVQLHGGVGFSEELAVGHYLKRLTMIDMAFGNADHQRARFAALSQAPAAA
ncbi:acyl-CoA dehydrogenase family protein [Phenylobacterium sp.]|uniref:acyl-CoA dehydrogenase family protein n=1 Tax=Phenylobacterium sp. TaxID=1871053 RepID=UPI0025ED78E6|nr:acyl-CoA dehydrogenase family protein [Phenylobacterium sp.]